MKKFAIVTALCLALGAAAGTAAFAQTRPTLAILPFTGGSAGDGETLAELFSFDQTLNSAFTPVPRTSINAAIQKEQSFQMASGMTDPETISRIGKQLGARYIVAGSITRLGGQQLLVIAIMQIENLQQIAGEWLTYQNISEVRGKLPDMAKNIVAASRNNTSRLQKLAVLPFQMPSGDREADALAQILAAEIIKSGTYAVFPRTKTLEQVQAEYNTQTSGITDDYSLAAIGRGDNPLLALSGAARRLGQDRMFNAAIINVEDGTQVKGDSVEYQVIEDSIEAIQKLAGLLTSGGTSTGRLLPANFVRVEGGTFQMGSNNGNNNEKPVHTVTVKSFSIGKYEVTQREWQEVMGNNPSNFKGDNRPVEKVSWFDAVEYCNKLSLKEGLTPAYRGSGNNITCDWSANGYRLPTEAEWEFAAKGGTKDYLTTEYSGSNSVGTVAWYKDNSGGSTQPVGTKAANSLGIHDMSGNVWEWCWDWYGDYSGGSQTDPRGPVSGADRVGRGGGWIDPAERVRSAERFSSGNPSGRYYYYGGFRVARN
jgi:formylglycine-generating enzyme required for sulfatase activity/TolB-like protein